MFISTSSSATEEVTLEVLRNFAAHHQVGIQRGTQHSIHDSVVATHFVVMRHLLHQLVCRRMMPRAEQSRQSKMLSDFERVGFVLHSHSMTGRDRVEHSRRAWKQ